MDPMDPRKNAKLVGRRIPGMGPNSLGVNLGKPKLLGQDPPSPPKINQPAAIPKTLIEAFERIRNGDAVEIALMDVEFDEVHTAVIVSMSREAGDFNNINVVPLAIMVTPELFFKLKPPAGGSDIITTTEEEQ